MKWWVKVVEPDLWECRQPYLPFLPWMMVVWFLSFYVAGRVPTPSKVRVLWWLRERCRLKQKWLGGKR